LERKGEREVSGLTDLGVLGTRAGPFCSALHALWSSKGVDQSVGTESAVAAVVAALERLGGVWDREAYRRGCNRLVDMGSQGEGAQEWNA